MAVIRSIKVDIPKSHVTIERQKNGKPALIKYVLEAPYNREKGYPQPKRTIIGHQCLDDPTKMYPTTQYAAIFPDAWEKTSGEKARPVQKNFGLFTLCEAINGKTGIKDTLDGVYGKDASDAIIDYAMYSILHKSDAASVFHDKMGDQMLYSGEAKDDSWYSDLFEHRMSEEQALQFRKEWALHCKKDGADQVWLCIDGSNDDCHSRGVEIAEKGDAKSKKNVNIVSFTYAVTEDGLPVTFDVYEGGLVDAKAMKKVIDFLTECGISLRGVILDRGYCSKPSLEYLNSLGIAYVIMVKGQPDGFSSMVAEYGNKIKMNSEYLVPGTFLFGVQQEKQLFRNYKHTDHVTLFFDYRNGSERVTALLKNLYAALEKAEGILMSGKKPTSEDLLGGMVRILTEKTKDGEEESHAGINLGALQLAIDEKGLYSVVSSEKMTPAQVNKKYASRGASETQYMFLKTQLGYGTVRVHYTQGVYARFLTAFVASVLRYETEQASKSLGRTTTQMIDEVNRIKMVKIDGVYTYTHTEKARVTDFFKKLDKDCKCDELIDSSVRAENDRLKGRVPTLRHRKTGPKPGSHHKKYDDEGNMIPRKSGVKKGTKRADTNQDGTPRKKPGIPAGTKRGIYNKDGSLRKKPGPKPGSHHTAGD